MINKKKIADLLSNFSIENIEKEFVMCFLNNQKIDYTLSSITQLYFKDYSVNNDLNSAIKVLKIDSIKALENCLELLIPENDRKLNGAFFTPTYIVDYIINELKPAQNQTNIDLSCGCGAFLIGLVDYYHTQYGESIKKVVKKNIFGSDILSYNIARAKLLLTLYALQSGEILEESDFNLYVRDSLRHNWTEKYDNVVGNPPYVKFQDLSQENRNYLVSNWSTTIGGTFNLYFAFFELGYNLLKENGRLGYITPNNYFTSLAGEPLRAFFLHKRCLDKIIDFNSKKVFDVQTYTAITFLKKNKGEVVSYDRILESQTPDVFLSNINYSDNTFSELNAKKWRLLKFDDKRNIELIEKAGTPIKQMFDICVGVATLKDNLFFVDGCSTNDEKYLIKIGGNGKGYKIEREITRSVYKISDFKSQKDIQGNARRIIFPYTINGSATVISEDNFKESFPYCYEYLLSVKEELLSRDKGKVKINPFYAWGRTQGLTKFGKKILNPTFSQQPRFLIVEDEDSVFTNGYGIFFKEQPTSADLFGNSCHLLSRVDNIDLVQKVLNSNIMHYYISRTSVSIEGGYPCYQKNFIEKFTIPEFSDREAMELRLLTNPSDINLFLSDKYQINLPSPNLSL